MGCLTFGATSFTFCIALSISPLCIKDLISILSFIKSKSHSETG